MRVVGIVPARYLATRFEGKALADLAGEPMIWWVYCGASRSKMCTHVVVATDDQRIFDAVRTRGGECVMTRPDHASGTDRVAEAGKRLGLGADDIAINVQGDEPLLQPEAIDLLAEAMIQDPAMDMATLIHPVTSDEEIQNPNVVKVVVDGQGWALYFSRSPIPYRRKPEAIFYRHIGIYGYRFGFLERLISESPTSLEKTECLEQLRVLELGYRIRTVVTSYTSIGVDTLADLEEVRRIIREGGLSAKLPTGRNRNEDAP